MKKFIFVFFFLFSFNARSQQWNVMNGGLIGSGSEYVKSLCWDSVHNVLWAGGSFDINNQGDTLNNLSYWDGNNWFPFLNIITQDTFLGFNGGKINSLLMYKGDLIIAKESFPSGNSFYNIVSLRIDSNNVKGIGKFNESVRALCIFDDTLYASGEFTTYTNPYPPYNSIPVNHIAKWNGTDFVSVGNGIDAIEANTMCVYNNKLVVGGLFEYASGVYCKNIAQWDGTSWSAIGNGIGIAGNLNDFITDLCVYHGKLYAGGGDLTNGNDLVVWNGSNWSAVSNYFNFIGALYVFNDKLYVGGNTNLNPPWNYVTVFNDTVWSATGKGPISGGSPGIYDFAEHNNKLIAAGMFHYIGELPGEFAGLVAEYDATPNAVIEISGEVRLVIFPNPVTDDLTIQLNSPCNNCNLEITNTTGVKIISQNIKSPTTQLNIKSLPSGIYFIKFQTESGETQVKKFVKK